MENKITYDRPAEQHPAVQNLRWFFREFVNNGGSVKSFAQKVGMTKDKMGEYLRGKHNPGELKIRDWAEQLGVDYEYMMTVEFDYIPYPLTKESKKKKSGRHITMGYIDKTINVAEINARKVCEDNDIEYATTPKDTFDQLRKQIKQFSRSLGSDP